MTLPLVSLDTLTLLLWALVLGTIAYPVIGYLVDALREWLWLRDQRRSMTAFQRLRRRGAR